MKKFLFAIAIAAATVSCSNEAASTEGTTVDTTVVAGDTSVVTADTAVVAE
jgi:hypothetical protein